MQPRTTVPAQPLTRRLRRVRRALLLHRRGLAALLAGAAVLAGIRATTAAPEATTTVLVARTDLPGGVRVDRGDLVTTEYPAGTVPEGAITREGDVVGRVLAAPLRQGEPLTDLRVVAPTLLEGYPGQVAAPVRVADPAVVALLAPGDRVDLVATPPDGGSARVVVHGATVVAVPRPARRDAGLTGGGLLVVAVTEDDALDLAGASASAVLSVVLGRPDR